MLLSFSLLRCYHLTMILVPSGHVTPADPSAFSIRLTARRYATSTRPSWQAAIGQTQNREVTDKIQLGRPTKTPPSEWRLLSGSAKSFTSAPYNRIRLLRMLGAAAVLFASFIWNISGSITQKSGTRGASLFISCSIRGRHLSPIWDSGVGLLSLLTDAFSFWASARETCADCRRHLGREHEAPSWISA